MYSTLNAWVRRAGIFASDKAEMAVPTYTTGKGLSLSARTCYVSLDSSEEVPPMITVVVALSANESGRTRVLMNRRKADGEWSAVDLARISTNVLSSMSKLKRLHAAVNKAEKLVASEDEASGPALTQSTSKRNLPFSRTRALRAGNLTAVATSPSEAAGVTMYGATTEHETSVPSSSSTSGRPDEHADDRSDEREEARYSAGSNLSRPPATKPEREGLPSQEPETSPLEVTPVPKKGSRFMYHSGPNSSSNLLNTSATGDSLRA